MAATKSKTRRAPAAKTSAPEPAVKEEPGQEKSQDENIGVLLARWQFLNAEERYKAALEPDQNWAAYHREMHKPEKAKIRAAITDAVPKTFGECYALLDFVTAELDPKIDSRLKPEIQMLRNLRAGLFAAYLEQHGEALFAKSRILDEIRWEFKGKVKIE